MNCYDCIQSGVGKTAVATCHDCGAGICHDHAREHHKRVTGTFAWSHAATIDPPQRRIRCTTCAAAINTIAKLRSPARHRKAG